MRDPRHVTPPADERGRLARLLIIALGLVGLVVVPAMGTAAGAGAASGIRAGVPQTGPKAPGKDRTGRPRTVRAAGSACCVKSRTGSEAPVRTERLAAAPATRQLTEIPTAVADPAVPPPGVSPPTPPSGVRGTGADGDARPAATVHDRPRGRAPPASTALKTL